MGGEAGIHRCPPTSDSRVRQGSLWVGPCDVFFSNLLQQRMMRHDGEAADDWHGMRRRRSDIEGVCESENDAGEESSSFCLPGILLHSRICNGFRAPVISLPPPAR